MTRSLSILLAAVLVAGGLFAGCGSSKKKSSSSTTSTTASTTASTPTTSTSGSSGSVPTNVAEAVAACKKGVNAYPQISSSLKGKLNKLCEKAGSGDQAEAKKIGKQVCEELVKSSGVPAGSARDQALAACKKA